MIKVSDVVSGLQYYHCDLYEVKYFSINVNVPTSHVPAASFGASAGLSFPTLHIRGLVLISPRPGRGETSPVRPSIEAKKQ